MSLGIDDVKKYFSPSQGFNEHRDTGIELLRTVTEIFDEFNITYFLISGTLLGQARSDDFIPWDDDLDVACSQSIHSHIPEIMKKYGTMITIMIVNQWILKICFKNKVFPIGHQGYAKYIYEKNDNDKYMWPFIDLFVYGQTDQHLSFFRKLWEIEHFLPVKSVDFLGMKVNVPSNSSYFLNINYGDDYTVTYVSPSWNHRKDGLVTKVIKVNLLTGQVTHGNEISWVDPAELSDYFENIKKCH